MKIYNKEEFPTNVTNVSSYVAVRFSLVQPPWSVLGLRHKGNISEASENLKTCDRCKLRSCSGLFLSIAPFTRS